MICVACGGGAESAPATAAPASEPEPPPAEPVEEALSGLLLPSIRVAVPGPLPRSVSWRVEAGEDRVEVELGAIDDTVDERISRVQDVGRAFGSEVAPAREVTIGESPGRAIGLTGQEDGRTFSTAFAVADLGPEVQLAISAQREGEGAGAILDAALGSFRSEGEARAPEGTRYVGVERAYLAAPERLRFGRATFRWEGEGELTVRVLDAGADPLAEATTDDVGQARQTADVARERGTVAGLEATLASYTVTVAGGEPHTERMTVFSLADGRRVALTSSRTPEGFDHDALIAGVALR